MVWVNQETRKKFRKNTNIGIQQNPGLISYILLRTPFMPNWKALTKKMTSGMPKMSKSHDRPVYAYLMR